MISVLVNIARWSSHTDQVYMSGRHTEEELANTAVLARLLIGSYLMTIVSKLVRVSINLIPSHKRKMALVAEAPDFYVLTLKDLVPDVPVLVGDFKMYELEKSIQCNRCLCCHYLTSSL